MASYNARIDLEVRVKKALANVDKLEERISKLGQVPINIEKSVNREVKSAIESFKRLGRIVKSTGIAIAGLSAGGALGLLVTGIQKISRIDVGAIGQGLQAITKLDNALLDIVSSAPGATAAIAALTAGTLAFAPQIARAAVDTLRLGKALGRAKGPLKALLDIAATSPMAFAFGDLTKAVEAYQRELFETSETVSELSRRQKALQDNLDRFNSSSETAAKIAGKLVDVNARLNNELREQRDLLRAAAGVNVTELEATKGRKSIETRKRAEQFRLKQLKEELELKEALGRLEEESIQKANRRLDLQAELTQLLNRTTDAARFRAKQPAQQLLLPEFRERGLQLLDDSVRLNASQLRIETALNGERARGVRFLEKQRQEEQRQLSLGIGGVTRTNQLPVNPLRQEQAVAAAAAKRTESLAIEQRIQRTAASTVTQYNLMLGVLDKVAAIGKQISEATEQEIVNQRRLNRQLRVREGRARQRASRRALSEGLIGGAFPLLFGQGLGASAFGGLGGAAGGALGGQFGFGLSLVGTAVGSTLDDLNRKLRELAVSLKDPTAGLAALEELGFKVSDSTKNQIDALVDAGKVYDAQTLLFEEIANRLGTDSVNQLNAFGEATDALDEEFAKAQATLISELIPTLTVFTQILAGVVSVINKLEIPKALLELGVGTAVSLVVPGAGVLGPQVAGRGFLNLNQRLAPGTEPDRNQERLNQFNLERIQGNKVTLLQNEIDLIKVGNNLLDETVFKEREKAILGEFSLKRLNAALAGELDLVKVKELELRRDTALNRLAEERARQQERLDKKSKRKTTGIDKEARILKQITQEGLKQNALEQKINLVGQDRLSRVRAELASLENRETLERAFIISSTEDVRLQNAKLKTLALQFELKEAQLKQTEKELILQRQLKDITRGQELADLRRGLERELESGQLPTGDPFRDPFIALEREQRFRRDDIFRGLSNREELLRGQLTGIAPQDTETLAQIKNIEDQRAAYESLLPSIEANQRAQLLYNQTLSQVEGPVNALVGGLQDIVAGTKTAQEVFADFLKTIADQLIQTAATMIAQYIAIGIAKAFAFGGGGGGGLNTDKLANVSQYSGITAGTRVPFAEGGYVTGPTNALIGEGGEPEYVIPRSKMRESMARYSRGARGSSVIPSQAGGGDSEMSGGTAVAAPIDVRYTVERINSVDYVTADQFQLGMQRAAQQGAAEGERRTLRSLKNSPGTRRGVGM